MNAFRFDNLRPIDVVEINPCMVLTIQKASLNKSNEQSRVIGIVFGEHRDDCTYLESACPISFKETDEESALESNASSSDSNNITMVGWFSTGEKPDELTAAFHDQLGKLFRIKNLIYFMFDPSKESIHAYISKPIGASSGLFFIKLKYYFDNKEKRRKPANEIEGIEFIQKLIKRGIESINENKKITNEPRKLSVELRRLLLLTNFQVQSILQE
ncbi:hypothetical protein O9G_005231 [Rozella allomycis CSF55]|uniref:JAB1/MPN/MOV34 metalloenzyme domain-containing protein n=1 Tax=Rozella allomycis (strain CSF55) TaxID=988480 RepID=A0A075AXC4_ROZAC|nr:hypothetical protein O9G_005231 [Rozella allomycis CSF55]|eukprot:EPZ34794.1 hypothetical protein O9G_005231 [Rozella allomycis CSF55]